MLAPRQQTGLTLLELVVSLLILSILTSVAIRSVGPLQDQARYEQTVQQLENVRSAIVGDKIIVNNAPLLNGFVADNGILPNNAADLLQKPTGFDDYGLQSPVFDAQPDPDGFNNADNPVVVLDLPNEQLRKGYRFAYLQQSVGQTTFVDGWGQTWQPNQAVDTDSDGLLDRFQLGSQGADASLGGSQFDQDSLLTISTNQWSFKVEGLTVTVTIHTTETLADSLPSLSLSLSLLVYQNSTDGGRWKQFQSDNCNFSCPDDCNVSCTCTCACTFSKDKFIPQGEHLLVIIDTGTQKPLRINADNMCTDSDTDPDCKRITLKYPFYSTTAQSHIDWNVP